MRTTVMPGNIKGAVAAPSAKSMTQRAFAAALLHTGQTTIYGAGDSEDELAALGAIRQLGATASVLAGGGIHISANGISPLGSEVDCGESGLAARLFTPIAALAAVPLTVTGRGTLLSRPMPGIKEALTALGVTIETNNGYLPLTLMGPITPASISVSGNESSQFVSGLLFALSACAVAPVTLTVTALKSRPYIDLTLDVLNRFGRPIVHTDYREFYIDPSLFTLAQRTDIFIEGDWSGAANLLAAGALAGQVTVINLNNSSQQADKAILQVLRQAGAAMRVEEDTIEVSKAKLSAFEFDATHCPDLFPILDILAAGCKGESYIRGVHRLFHKESNRAESIAEMLQNFDVPYSIEDDALCVEGVDRLQGTVIDAFGDHRIAMAAAVGALRANGPVDILNAASVHKSYPAFFKDLSLCGITCISGGE